jgi:hypothetical protein
MVATIDLAQGLVLWTVAMLLPLLMTFIKNGEFRILVLTLVYPNLLSFLARSGHFWVSHKVVLAASLAAFLVSLLLRLSPKARDAIDNPDSALSGVLIATIVIVFFAAMWGASAALGMYDSSNFSSSE